MLGSWEIAYIDSTHRKLSKTGLRCSGTILEGGVLFIDQKATIGSCSCSRVNPLPPQCLVRDNGAYTALACQYEHEYACCSMCASICRHGKINIYTYNYFTCSTYAATFFLWLVCNDRNYKNDTFCAAVATYAF